MPEVNATPGPGGLGISRTFSPQVAAPVNAIKTESTGAQREDKAGKGAYHLISPIALRRVSMVYEAGGKMRGDRNWEKGLPLSSYMNSALRHLEQYAEGFRDEGHVEQCMWNIMALIHTDEMIRRGLLPSELNDLPSYIPPELKSILGREPSPKDVENYVPSQGGRNAKA